MLQITITPTMLTFKDLSDELANTLFDEIGIKWNEKGYYFIQGEEKKLFQTLLKLSYNYDIELI